MALSRQDVEHIAHLARLEVSEDEIADYVAKLSSILDMVAQLGETDTTGVEPMAHPLDMAQRLRPDDVTESDQREFFQRNSADVAHGLYRVPRVIE
ncbi:MAG: Asp-tRNA(Asn)/Glu-tRNA(Gln) amidotransferase subunit GatC [Gammaproteobacteria bacterium]|nr:Asp-tRNA(Asn)/Glu-tRNA(Gln) amidotransferase subunit GatC [Gammaproteobacteria bacterium]